MSRRQLTELLAAKFLNPMLGLLGAHLLLARPTVDRELLHAVIGNVESLLGADFADVVALRLALAHLDSERAPAVEEPVGVPPLLRTSWQILASNPRCLAENSLAREIAPHLVPNGIWTAWQPLAGESSDDVLRRLRFLGTRYALRTFPGLGELLSAERESAEADERPGGAASTESAVAVGSGPGDNRLAAPALIGRLVREVPWERLLDDPQVAAARERLILQLSNFQKMILPTLRIIRRQIERGHEFTFDDLQSLLVQTGVPLDVAVASVADLAAKVYAALRTRDE